MTDNSQPHDDEALALLAETENFAVLTGKGLDGEVLYNIELGSVTLHLFQEEWDEFVDLVNTAKRNA